MTTYVPGAAVSPEETAALEGTHDATVHIVGAEDYVVAAEAWRNLNVHAKGRTLVYGRQEIALQNVHRAIAEAIGAAPHGRWPEEPQNPRKPDVL